jgi:hypothetical protein
MALGVLAEGEGLSSNAFRRSQDMQRESTQMERGHAIRSARPDLGTSGGTRGTRAHGNARMTES